MSRIRQFALCATAIAMCSACATEGLISTPTGSTAAAVEGSTGGATSSNNGILRCAETLGTITVIEDTDAYRRRSYYSTTGEDSMGELLGQIMQQSNCFVVTVSGDEYLNDRIDSLLDQDRNGGDTRPGSNLQSGQRIATDFVMAPTIVFSDEDTGGTNAGAIVGGLLRNRLGVGGGGVSVENKVSEVNLRLVSVRSRAQLASGTGKASAKDFKVGLGGLLGGRGGLGLGGISTESKTPEGKATIAAMVDAYNQMVVTLQNYTPQTIEGGAGRGGRLGEPG